MSVRGKRGGRVRLRMGSLAAGDGDAFAAGIGAAGEDAVADDDAVKAGFLHA
jgi:hypothetical protein